MSRRTIPGLPLLLGALSVALAVAGPVASAPAAAAEPGWHVVRPGETLEALAARYLGDPRRWQEIHRLNPQLADPHRLSPGERLEVPFEPGADESAAQLRTVSRRVEEKPQPYLWIDARPGDLLRSEDGVRTYEASSAELRLGDGTDLVLTESSLVFLRPAAPTPRAAGRGGGGGIEIVAGQADLEAAAPAGGGGPAARPSGIEVVVGATRALPQPAADGTLRTRARRPDAGGAQVMVYDGTSRVEAAGEAVELERGTGTAVPEAGPPAPPEPLLPAPELAAPAAGAALAFDNPALDWRPVPGAAGYTVELCADPDCAALVARETGLDAPPWRPAALPVGDHHWRVTAVSPSGLDGYPSPGRALAITAAGPDREAPTVTLDAVGPAFRAGSLLYLGPGARLEPTVAEAGGGEALVGYRLDGAEVAADAWETAWPGGERLAELVATDYAGNRGAASLAFTYDDQPPVLERRTGGLELLADHGDPRAARPETLERPWLVPDDHRPRRRRSRVRPLLLLSTDGRTWVPLAWSRSRPVRWRAPTLAPQLFLQTAGRRSLRLAPRGAEPVLLEPGELVHLRAEDPPPGCGVRELRVAEAGDAAGARYLVIEAEDCVGNRTREEWRVAPVP